MAALGAAAGAFEGDNAREEQRARRAGLGLQAASLAQQDRQFVEKQKLQREDMSLEADRIAGNQRLEAERTAMMQRNADKGFALDEQKLASDKENDVYQRGRNEKQDAWQAVLDEQTVMEKKQEYQQNEAAYQEAAKVRKQFDDQLANRRKVVQSVTGTLIRDIAESPNHVLSPAMIEWAKKQDPETFANLSGGGGGKPGSPMFLGFKDPKTGEDKIEPVDVEKQYMIFDTLYGTDVANTFTGRVEQEKQNEFSMKRDKGSTARTMNPVEEITQLNKALSAMKDEVSGEYSDADAATALKKRIVSLAKQLGGEAETGDGGASGDKASGSKFGFVKGGGSGEVVERTLKNGQKVRVRQLSNGKWEVVGGVPQEQAEPVMEEQPNKRSFRGVDGPRVTSSNGEVKSNFGPEPGTTEYWRDMPRGQATGMSKREIGFARRDILKRLESAHRKGPKSRDEAAKIKAELDAFNDKYPV